MDDMFVIVSSWQTNKPPKLESASGHSYVARYSAKCLGAVVCVSFLWKIQIYFCLLYRVFPLQ